MDLPPKVMIKGIREGLLITLGDGPWDEVKKALLDHLNQHAEFLEGGRIALDVGNHVLKAAELGQLRRDIADKELTLWAVISQSSITEKTARDLGLSIQLDKKKIEPGDHARETIFHGGDNAVLVRRTLRSGFSVQHHGHVIVIGDLNPGAEIIAAGDIIVWGHLRGMVHAGAEGNEDSIVCALDLSPTQLRIAGKIAITPKRRGKPQPEIAKIKDGQVMAQLWNPKVKSVD